LHLVLFLHLDKVCIVVLIVFQCLYFFVRMEIIIIINAFENFVNLILMVTIGLASLPRVRGINGSPSTDSRPRRGR